LGIVTANELKTHVAKRSNRQSPDVPSGLIHQLADTDPDSEWVTIFSTHIFQAACGRIQAHFEPNTWQCFEATWIQRISAAEVADSLGIPIHSVYVNKSRVLKRLEEEVKLLADDSPFTGTETPLN
jgi:DNA-directed RNA polymerase specialized sigma24 family protein